MLSNRELKTSRLNRFTSILLYGQNHNTSIQFETYEVTSESLSMPFFEMNSINLNVITVHIGYGTRTNYANEYPSCFELAAVFFVCTNHISSRKLYNNLRKRVSTGAFA